QPHFLQKSCLVRSTTRHSAQNTLKSGPRWPSRLKTNHDNVTANTAPNLSLVDSYSSCSGLDRDFLMDVGPRRVMRSEREFAFIVKELHNASVNVSRRSVEITRTRLTRMIPSPPETRASLILRLQDQADIVAWKE